MCNGEAKGGIALQVTKQNAGIILSRQNDNIVFQPFELAPCNAQVLPTRGRLCRSFPSSTIAIKVALLQDDKA
ncbi:hypothetical protein BDV96DRAFT_564873 [Lophiotrema nucula]|uniref:DUF6606 domain-containing protein n=1 Tax=Lophiotrema nucula TaxID=690887 RepID=A0A6A5ZQE6_9PLEO|nr:hypothetical protein BDV96DRAFT_564873 [Lophiotrema nucula]